MRERMLGTKLASLLVGLAASTMMVSGATAASADPVGIASLPELGVNFVADGDGAQCKKTTEQEAGDIRWTVMSDWTPEIGIDTDNRSGGCRLAFGIRDQSNTLANFGATYTLTKSGGSADGQCGDNNAANDVPITRFLVVGSQVRLDSDSRGGWCELTINASGDGNHGLDIQFYGSSSDDQDGQCRNALPAGQWRTAVPGVPVTLQIDTDGRAGWCNLRFRLRPLP